MPKRRVSEQAARLEALQAGFEKHGVLFTKSFSRNVYFEGFAGHLLSFQIDPEFDPVDVLTLENLEDLGVLVSRPTTRGREYKLAD